MRGRWFIISGAAALLALAGAAILVLPRISAKRTKPAAPVAEAPTPAGDINLSGKIRAKYVISMSAPIEGTIGAFFVDVGQEVFEGQLLARLSNEGLETGQQAAQRDLELTQTRINTLESEIVSARLEASRARADASRARGKYDRLDKIYRRQQMLFSEGATPRLTFEKSSRDFDLAKSEFRTLEQVAANADSRVAGLIKHLDSEKRVLREKTDALETAKAKSAAAELVSPVQGLVVGRSGDVGQPVSPYKADLFQIATQLSQLETVLEPDPPTLRRIQPGQAALVSLPDQGADGMPGSVKSIEGDRVIVAFTSPNPAVKPGMLAQVRIRMN